MVLWIVVFLSTFSLNLICHIIDSILHSYVFIIVHSIHSNSTMMICMTECLGSILWIIIVRILTLFHKVYFQQKVYTMWESAANSGNWIFVRHRVTYCCTDTALIICFYMVSDVQFKQVKIIFQFERHQGAVSIRKTVLPGMAIPMLKIRRPNGRLIFNMEITIRR